MSLHKPILVNCLLLSLGVGCVDDQQGGSGSETGDGEPGDGDGEPGDGDGEPGDGDGEPGDGDGAPGDGDGAPGDGDGSPTEPPCGWTAEPPTMCQPSFVPVPPPAQIDWQQYVFTVPDVDIVAHADSVEIAWRQLSTYEMGGAVGTRTYVLNNQQGMWQSQLVLADACPDCVNGFPVWILGSSEATRVAPYLRRVAGEWQLPSKEPPYDSPWLAAVGSDDRSYLVQKVDNSAYHVLVWRETEDGCHVPVWRLRSGPSAQCRRSLPYGAAVDTDGALHLIGSEQLNDAEWQIVYWKVGMDNVERREVAPVPEGLHDVSRPLQIDESGAFHTCYPPLLGEGVTIYAHGHDANDLVELHLDDPGFHPLNAFDLGQTYCKLALAPDGVAWLTWATQPYGAFRVAFVEDDVVTYEDIDSDAGESSAQLVVDSQSRPWLVYLESPGFAQTIKVAHREGDMWIVEQVSF